MKLKSFIGQRIFFFARAHTRIYRSVFVIAMALSLAPFINAATNNQISIDANTAKQIRAIGDPNTQICLPAIEILGHSKNAAAVKPLADAFARENRPVVRRYIVDALGNLRNRLAIPTLKQALNDPDLQVRQSAVAAVGLLGASDVQVILLEHASREKDPVIKRQMVHHLRLIQTPEAKNAIKTFSQDSDASVREMAGQQPSTVKRENR